MYTFKKVLAFALATLMICSCMVFTTFAADTPVAQATEGETIIPISTCETTDGFSTGSSGVVDTTDPWAGNASLATTISGVAGKTKIMYQYKNETMTFDGTAMKTLVFDVYVSSAAAFKDTIWKIELRGQGDGESKQRVIQKTLSELLGEELVDGWNHVELSIGSMEKKGSPNMHLWNWFRIYNNGGTAGIGGETHVIKLDNIYMTSREAKSNLISIQTSEFSLDKITGASKFANKDIKLSNTIDISMMDMVQFDVRVSDAAVNDLVFGFTLTSSGSSGTYRLRTGHHRTLEQLIGERVEADGKWHTVSVPLSSFSHAKNSERMDLTKCNFFQVYKQPVANSAVTTECKVDFRNVCLTKDDTAGEELIWDAKDLIAEDDPNRTDWELKEKCSIKGYEPSMGDVDGDGVNEWVLVDVEGDGKIYRQGGYNDGKKVPELGKGFTLPAFKCGVLFTSHAGYSNMTGLKFDLYIENETQLDKKIQFELCSAGKADVYEISDSKKLKQWFGGDLKAGWNTVEFSLSDFTKATSGSEGVFQSGALDFIRIMSDEDYDFTGGLALAIRNISVVRETPEKKDIGTIAVPGSLRVDDLSYASATQAFMLKWFDTNTALDISHMDAIQFDVKVGHEDVNSLYVDVHMSDTASHENNRFRIGYDYTLGDLAGGNIPADGEFHTVTVPLSLFTHSNGTADLSAINFLQIYNYQKDIGETNAGFMEIENIRFAAFPMYDEVKIKSASLNLHEAFNIIYATTVDKTMTGVGMLFEVTDANGTVTRKQIAGQQGADLNELLFTYKNIYPQNMTDNICTTLWAVTRDGKLTMDKVSNYSVKEYCSNMLDGIANKTVLDRDGTLATLLCDTLAYGAAVQQYINYNTDNLATDGVDMSAATTLYAPPPQFPKFVGEQGDCPAEFFSGSAKLENICKLRITFKAEDITGLKLNFAPNTGEKIITFDSGSFNMETIKDEKDVLHEVYVVEIPIRPYERDRAYVITFEGYEDYMMIYSLGTYLASMRSDAMAKLEAATDPAEIEKWTVRKNLYEATIAYGASARNYAASQH